MNRFIHLKAQSEYSLGQSIIKIPDLVKAAVQAQMPAICLMDRGNLFGSLAFSMECVKNGVKPIIGCQLEVDYKPQQEQSARRPHAEYGVLSLIAKNKIGYQNLIYLVSNSYLKNPITRPHIKLHDLLERSEGLILLFDCFNSPVAQLLHLNSTQLCATLLQRLQQSFRDNIFLELSRTAKNGWESKENPLLEVAFKEDIPVVATNSIAFLEPKASAAHDALLCIVQGRYLLEDEREKTDSELYFKSEAEMLQLFQDLPEAIENTELIALKASIMPEAKPPMLPKFSQAIDDEDAELKNQALTGLENRLEKLDFDREKYLIRLNFELEIIIKMKFSGYFLIVSDFIKWSKKNDIPVGPGRGSGVGSLVAWALEITDLDPLQFGLLFERFLNPERVSMPDFDSDFCQERRDEVIQYVENRYGKDKVAQIITFGKMQARAVLRDVGRVMQIPYGLVDKICKMVPNNPAHPVTLSEAVAIDSELKRMRDDDPDLQKLLAISLELEGINRHVSTHAAGIIIADKPLIELVPLYIDSNSSMQTVQYSLKYADAAGLMKFDFLGLKTLTVIDKAIKLIKKHRSIDINFTDNIFDDARTYEMLSSGETAGVFQLEGAGVRDAIKQLRPDCLKDLIALTSLYRPGPMDNISSYINRKHGLEEPDYIHPKLTSLLQETYGIIIYQEQVMQIAQILADYSLGEADLLRRAMGKKNKYEMEEQRSLFIARSKKHSALEEKRAAEIFALIDKFASYGFNKSHAAAYSVISYRTAYLKAHYPAEFFVASMNAEVSDTSKIGFFCSEAKRFGITILSPNINASHDYFSIENGNIRYALGAIKGVGLKAIHEIQQIREQSEFQSIEDFAKRAGYLLNKRSIENLIKAGAFDILHENRRELYENLESLLKHCNQKAKQQPSLLMFSDIEHGTQFTLTKQQDWELRDKLRFEFESFGFYLSSNPLDEYSERFVKMHVIPASMLDSLKTHGVQKHLVVGVVTAKRVRSSKRGKYAFLQITDKTGVIDVAVFDEKVLITNDDLLVEGSAVICNIEVKQDENGRRIILESVAELHQYMSSTLSICRFYITNQQAIGAILPHLSATGAQVRLYAEFPDGSLVTFRSSLRIEHGALEQLKKIDGLRIEEE